MDFWIREMFNCLIGLFFIFGLLYLYILANSSDFIVLYASVTQIVSTSHF